MSHPTEGVLRRLLDEPAGVEASDREHVAGCPKCLGALAGVRDDADLVHAALGAETAEGIDVDRAWQRLSSTTAAAGKGGALTFSGSVVAPGFDMTTTPAAGRGRTVTPPDLVPSLNTSWRSPDSGRTLGRTGRSPKWALPVGLAASPGSPVEAPGRVRAPLRRPVVAAAAVALVVTGAGAAGANGWLTIFRTERIAPVSLSAADLHALPDLSAYGDVEIANEPEVHPAPDAATAAAETGLDVPEVTTRPRGVTGQPRYQVGGEVSATFTFSAERAAQAAAEAGTALPAPPAGLDGSQVRLVAGPGVAAVWSHQAGVPSLVVGRAVAPKAFSSSGIAFETVRDYLLSLPGLPEEVAGPLRTFNADGSTLPLPVPADRVITSTATVDGQPATVFTTRDRSLAAVAWVRDGVVTVVAGPLDADEVLSVARGLR
ncbi:MAG: hypothetical protein ACT4OS_09380 [Acidimicrobiales bacterium]